MLDVNVIPVPEPETAWPELEKAARIADAIAAESPVTDNGIPVKTFDPSNFRVLITDK